MMTTVGIAELLIICFVVLILLVVVVAIVAFFLVLRSRSAGPAIAATAQTPLDILQARYARGEITAEQLGEMRRNIEGGDRPPAA